MKESLKKVVDTLHRYNTEHMAAQAYERVLKKGCGYTAQI